MPSRHLFVIRIALLAGVTAFAALVLWQRSRGAPTLASESGAALLGTLRLALYGLAGVALAAAFLLRTRIEGAAPAQRGAMTIVGWAFGEGVALFGTVLHYIGGTPVDLAIGVLTFALVLVLLPIPQPPR
jgi:hypothetical protein